MENFIIGQIVGIFGNKGEVKIYPSTDFPEKRFRVGNIVKIIDTTDNIIEKKIESAREHKKNFIVKLNDCNSIEEAEKFINNKIFIYKSELNRLPKGAYYIHEIIGISVYNLNNEYLGIVTDCFNTGANDIYVVTNGKEEILIPALKDVVKEIDIPNKKMLVELQSFF